MQIAKEVKIAAIGGGLAIFAILFGNVIFPAILKSQLKKEMALSKKTDVRKMWEKIPFALDFKIYLFNYTNPEEVHNGGVPIVKEVGPYYFEEWKEKVEIEDHEADDTITYKKRDFFYFKPELSNGLTGEELIIVPHIFIMSMVITVAREKPGMLSVANKAINGMFDNPPDAFFRGKSQDLLFKGFIINCNRTEFAPKAACTTIKKDAPPGLIIEPNNQFRLSLFGTKNGSIDPHVVTVKRGISNVMDVGQVVAIDGKPQMDIWRDTCNEYQGTDGTVFPPFLKPKDRLQSYSGDMCRSFKPWYEKKSSYRGIKTNRYVANIGDFANDPELQCFCDSIETCPPKGLMDLTKCVKAPLYASMPHFLDADPEIQKNVKGLHPDVNEHGIQIDFEPITGTPMVAKQRIQFNIQLWQTEKIDVCKNLPNTIVPLFWIEEGLALNKTFVKMMKKQLFTPKRMVSIIKWLIAVTGIIAAFLGTLYHYKDRLIRDAISGKVTKVNPEETEAKEISVIGQGPDQTHELPKIM